MPVRKDFKPGEFCWIDLAAHDLKAAAAWYGELFGWKAVNLTPGGPPYEFFMRGEAAAAAVAQMSDEMKAKGIPPMWNSYVFVESCEASEKKAAAWRQGAGTAHLGLDIQDARGGLERLEFIGYGPAGRAGDLSQAILKIEAVDLDDQAVDFVRKVIAASLHLFVVGQYLFQAATQPNVGNGLKSPFL